MDSNRANMYMRNAVMTASPAELVLMLYDGAIRFCNMAIMAMEKKDIEGAHNNIRKAENIITELRGSLDRKYPVWEDFERVYEYIYRRLVEANMQKDPEIVEDALKYIREMRDTWKEVMRLNKVGQK